MFYCSSVVSLDPKRTIPQRRKPNHYTTKKQTLCTSHLATTPPQRRAMRTPLPIRARRYRPPQNYYRLLKACAVFGAKAGSYFPYGDITPCYDRRRYGCPYRRRVITALCQIAGFCPQKPNVREKLPSGERAPCDRLRARAGCHALFLRLPALAHKRPCVGSSEPAAVSHMLAHMVSRLGLNAATDTRRE